MPRPKTFDPDTALDRAIDVFWERGYEGTSVQDLVDRMRINRFSMYETFGDKRTLFLAALKRYRSEVAQEWLLALRGDTKGMAAIRGFFQVAVEKFQAPGGPSGCLLTNTAVDFASYDADISGTVNKHLRQVEDAFLHALADAAELGEVPGGDQRDRALYLLNALLGLCVLARAKPGRRRLERCVEQTLRGLG